MQNKKHSKEIKKMKINYMVRLILLLCFTSLPVYALDNGVESLRKTSKAFASVAKKVSPSVVFIQVEAKLPSQAIPQLQPPFGAQPPLGDDFFRRFFGDQFPGMPQLPPGQTPQMQPPQGQQRVMGQGSGFVFWVKDGILSDKTYILTNNHVVDNAEKIRVKFNNGREYNAKITGRDPKSDVAVIEIKATGLPAIPLGDSSKLEVGEWVLALGNPFGLSHTLTVGVVSAKGRSTLGINDYEDFIQTDAAINPGNSGGPLVNIDGEVVGINTAIFSRSGGNMGIGFAIPINLAKAIGSQLIEKGEVTRGYLGVVIQPLTPDLADSFGIDPGQGILVAQVAEGSPAQQAGIKQGDIIVEFEGNKVSNVGHFRNQVSIVPPGRRVEMTVLRDGERKKLHVTIGKLGKNLQVAKGPAQSSAEIGLTVQTLTQELAEQFNAKPGEGVVVTDVRPGSIAALAGIQVGTVILQVNRKTVKNAEDFKREIAKSKAKKRVLLLIRNGDFQRYIALSW